MLSVEENQRLTQVGPGSPMGEMMRRYWHPIAASAELDENPTKEVRLLGEDLVLYRDRSGNYGLIERFCAHRRVNLAYGIPEENGLRCMYHGWMYDETGQCVEQPFEETVRPEARFKDKIKLRGYPVENLAGLLWAYMGPAPAPLLPRWEQLVWDDAVRDIAITEIPCNWLQCQENSLDPTHLEWLHRYFGEYVRMREGGEWKWGQATPPMKHLEIGFDLFEHGIVKRRVLEGYTREDDDWKHGHPILFPNILLVGSETQSALQFRVPVDDTHTFHVSLYTWKAAPGKDAPKQDSVPYRYVPLYADDDRFVVNLTFNQDYTCWVTQGPSARRDLEKLGESDRGLIMFRKLLGEQINVVQDGGDPMNVFRDAERNASIPLPLEKIKFGMLRTNYIPLEAGPTTAVEDVEEVLRGWADFYGVPVGAEKAPS